jgi:hypothetical protein
MQLLTEMVATFPSIASDKAWSKRQKQPQFPQELKDFYEKHQKNHNGWQAQKTAAKR